MQRLYVKEDEKSYVQVNNPDTIYNMFKELQFADQAIDAEGDTYQDIMELQNAIDAAEKYFRGEEQC